MMIHLTLSAGMLAAAIGPAFAADADFQLGSKRVPLFSKDEVFQASDKRLAVGAEGITINELSALAKEKKFDVLEKLFKEYAVTVACLPHGHSAGAPGGVFVEHVRTGVSGAFTELAGLLWQGKVFSPGAGPECRSESNGENRVSALEYIKFVPRLIGKSSLASTRASNMVELNYSAPGVGVLPLAVRALGVYDLMAAVPGKYGPLYIGKTWLGRYNKGNAPDSFVKYRNSKQVAWFFLDFSEGALNDQKQDGR
ncbi:MAG: hypothetical protein HY078_08120 [Elusimicrobia bacterium]|nr:hypothetical protein [Elusimicrobiota bacterium]